MSNGNPIEQLRRRLQSQATPTAFAALAEEYRRAGRFADAITVCREGLQRYPAYASARVTLGRALLDSGDVPAAVAELEQAAAQSPDNLAAARALQSAHDALGEDPAWPSAAASPPGGDLPLRSPADEDTDSIAPDVIARALSSGPDSPQEFGLGPDWSIPDTVPAGVTADPDPQDEWVPAMAVSAVLTSDHAESPTMPFVPPHLQGDEPAGIWAAPAAESSPPAALLSDGARVFSWALDPPEVSGHALAAAAPADPVEPISVWDAPTMHAPLVEVAEAEPSPLVEVSSAGLEWTADMPETDVTPQEVMAPPFAGWADVAPPEESGPDRSPWASEVEPEPAESWTVPDGPSATWALGDLHEAAGADATPFRDSLDAPDSTPVPFAGLAPSSDAPSDPPATVAGVAWAGSVRSALGEVFALAGHGESLEPPTPASPAVRAALADVAVQAAIEDAALRDDPSAPVLASLEQMLAAVRARRAELAGRTSS